MLRYICEWTINGADFTKTFYRRIDAEQFIRSRPDLTIYLIVTDC